MSGSSQAAIFDMDGVLTRAPARNLVVQDLPYSELEFLTWQALVFGFLGVRFTDAGPQADARAAQRLPAGWDCIELTLAYRGGSHAVKVAQATA